VPTAEVALDFHSKTRKLNPEHSIADQHFYKKVFFASFYSNLKIVVAVHALAVFNAQVPTHM
jgi:hypothetical protein